MHGVFGLRAGRAAALIGGCGAVAAGMLAAAAPAQAAALNCGTTIRASVTLTRDVNCTKNKIDDAITIGAAGITVNLNGHSIRGPGDANDTVAILDNGYSNVTVENGAISNFYTGVDAAGTSTSYLTRLVVRNLTVTVNSLSDSGDGVSGSFVSRASISRLSVKYTGDGVGLDNSRHSSISDSKFTGTSDGVYDNLGNSDVVSHNTMTGITDNGVESSETTHMVISSNAISGAAATGIYDNQGSRLTASGNSLSGLLDGISDDQGSHNTFSGNKGTGDAHGVLTYEDNHATYARNTFSNGAFGIEVGDPVGDTLTRNTTSRNTLAGIYVHVDNTSGDSAALSDNVADDNGFGLYSQIPTAGKDNHAKGNAEINCHNVRCV